jgi:hypothetical protein
MAVGHKEFTQKKPLQLVYLELGVGNGGMLLSLSEDGFRFRAVSPVRENTAMPFAFSLDGRNRLEGTGTVEWVEEDGKSGGMRFTEVSSEFRSLLGAWLNSDSSHHSGREAAPAAAAPDDTMEKIRQELRSGYPARPPEVTKFPEQKPDRQREQNTEQENEQKKPERKPERPPEPRREQHAEPKREPQPEQKIVARASSDKNISEKGNADKFLTERSAAQKSNRPTFAPAPEKTPEKISETKESFTASRLFPLPSFSTPHREQPAPSAASSAFLKAPADTKTPGRPGAAASTHSQSQTVTRDTQVFSPTSTLYGASSNAAESYAPAPTRPFIPPLEESFEQAWERAKFTSPSDSPHLSRAAAGSIIAIALAAILGALAYNFRQDIGSIFIQLGQSISGDNHPAAPAPAQETKPDGMPPEDPSQAQGSQPALSRQQNAPADPGNTANPPASSANKNSPTPSADTETSNPTNGPTNDATHDVTSGAAGGTRRGAAPAGKSRNSGGAVAPPMVAPVVKPPENSATGVAADPTLKNEAAADAASGQEEFLVARDLLHGSNRQQDLSRAVSLLWASVKKGHVPAEVTLADLYRRGDGVEKNCDQARVLLVAASKKGSFEARQMLEQIAERGCQ